MAPSLLSFPSGSPGGSGRAGSTIVRATTVGSVPLFWRERMQKHGLDPQPNSAQAFRELTSRALAEWSKVVRDAGIKRE